MRFTTLLSGLFSWQPFSGREISAVGDEITFSDAINAHRAWKMRLQESLAGNSPVPVVLDDICRDDRCELGIWLHGAGRRRYGGLHSFDELIARHAYFHELAGHVVKLAQAGQEKLAQRLLDQDLNLASNEITSRLKKFARVFDHKGR